MRHLHAGPSGYAVAFMLGFFVRNSSAWRPFSLMDSVPGDVCSSVILAAAAANLRWASAPA